MAGIMELRRRLLLSSPHIETITGNPLTFQTDMVSPLKSLVVPLSPVQDLHGQDAPYPAGGGVNKLPPMVDGTYTGNGVKAVVKDGIATLSGTTNASGNALIIPLAEEFTVPSQTCYLHSLNSIANGSVQPSYELASDPGGTSYAIAFNPANRIIGIGSNNYGHKWDRIRFYLSANITLSGTFSPMVCFDEVAKPYAPYSNICPITGFTGLTAQQAGKNLMPIGIVSGLLYNRPTGQSFEQPVATGSSWTQGTDRISYVTSSNYTNCSLITALLPAGDYIVSATKLSAGSLRFTGYALDKAFTILDYSTASNLSTKERAFSLPNGGYIAFYLDNGNTASQTLELQIQVELDSEASDYEPYQGEVIHVSWQIEAGMVYWSEYDVLNGVLSSEWKLYTLDGVEHAVSGSNGIFYPGLTTVYGIRTRINTYSSHYKGVSYGNRTTNFAVATSSAAGGVRINDSNYATAEEYNLYLKAQYDANTPVQILYRVEETVYQLDPITIQTLLGQNNIWTDTIEDLTAQYWSHI